MKIPALVPSKMNSQRIPNKNIALLDGVPLVNYAINTLSWCDSIDEIVVQSSSRSILDFINQEKYSVKFQKRPVHLDLDSAAPEDWIEYFCRNSKTDLIVLLHITSPFISSESIEEMINIILTKDFDSSFAAYEEKKFAWFNHEPLNYDPKLNTPRTQHRRPVMFEQSGLYIFYREYFLKFRKRIGTNPYIKTIKFLEYLDIDWPQDLNYVEFLIKNNLVSK